MDTNAVNAEEFFAPFHHAVLLRKHQVVYFIPVRRAVPAVVLRISPNKEAATRESW